MNLGESVSVWVSEKEVDEFYTTKFLELLLKYDYVWSPDDEIALSAKLGEDKTAQFLSDFSNFVEGIDEMKASKVLRIIKEMYNKEYHKLLAASKNKDQSKFFWFSKAHELFRESMVNESDEGKEHNESISSLNFPTIESGIAGETFTLKDPLSPETEDLTDDDPLSLPFEDSEDDRILSPPYETFMDEDSLLSRAKYFTDKSPLSQRAEASTNDEPLALEIHTFSNSKSLASRQEAFPNTNSLSSRDEAFIDGSSLASLVETFTERDSLTTFENITRNFSSQEGRACRDTISLSSATGRFIPPAARRSLSPAARRSLSPAARRSLSPAARRSLSPAARRSLSPADETSLSPAARRSLSPAARRSLSPPAICLSPTDSGSFSPVTRRSFSPTVESSSSAAERISPPADTRATISPNAIAKRNSFSLVSRSSLSPSARFSPTARFPFSPDSRSLSPVARRCLSPVARRTLSPVARKSLSPVARKSLSPVARKSLSPVARKSLSPVARKSLSPVARKSLSPVARKSLSPDARKSLSPVARNSTLNNTRASLPPTFKRELPCSRTSTSPGKQQGRYVIKESVNLNTSKKVRVRKQVRRKRSHTIPKRNLQQLMDLMKPTRSGNEITSCPTYSGVAWILRKANRTNDSSSNDVESSSIQTNSSASKIKEHSMKSLFPHEIISGKEKTTSLPSSFCPYTTDFSNLSRTCQQETEAADGCDLNSEVRSFVQSVALKTIGNVNRRSVFVVKGAAKGIASNGIFVNTATDILESLPACLASECEAFILHFLKEIWKRK